MRNMKKLLITTAISVVAVTSIYAAEAPAGAKQMPPPKA